MTWPSPTSTTAYSNVVDYSFIQTPYYNGQFWSTPALWNSTPSVSFDRPAFHRLMLARIPRPAAEPARASFLNRRADRWPELVRRAPRPAGRPYGWRRQRKGGRWT